MTLRLLSIGLALAATTIDLAQAQAPGAADQQRLDTVQITGSRLRRTDSETPSPVQVMTGEEIARSGAASLADVVRQLPANNIFSANENETVRARGSSGVSLHGLGAGATLVLINGRRVAPFGFAEAFGLGTFVDLNQIPVSAIERIEVLLDGASAVYGSDAVGGVVNVILRRDYRGAEATGAFGRSTHGDASQRQVSLIWGTGDISADGYNVFASYSHADQDPVRADARWHSRTADYRAFGQLDLRSTYAYPGNLYTADNRTFLRPLGSCRVIGEPGSPNPGRCLEDVSHDRDIVAGSRRNAVFASGTATMPGGFEVFGDALLGQRVFRSRMFNFSTASYVTSGTLPTGVILLPVGHPQNPYPFEVALRTRFADEPRVQTSTSDTQRVVAGFRHHDLAGWDLESALLWSHARTRVEISGVIDDAVLLREVVDANGRGSPRFRFGDPGANDPSLMARLYPEVVDSGTSSTTSIDLRGTRQLFGLPGGAAQLALGGEVRRERFSTAPDPRTTSGDLSALFGFKAAGAQTIGSAYAELSLPLARTLEVLLAERYDRYSDFGGTANSKVGLKWKAAPGLVLRSTYATAFRAPSPIETQQAPALTATQVRDPRLCPLPSLTNPNCDERVRWVVLGNPELRPERASTQTAGIVFEPWRHASVTLDAFRIRRRDEIGPLNLAYLLAHEADFPGDVVRRADGTLLQLNNGTKNLGSARIWGIDATAKASATFDFGRLGVDGAYEWLPHYQVAAAPGLPFEELAGTYAQPKSRARASLNFDRGPWRSSLTLNYTGKFMSVKTPSAVCPYADPALNHSELCTIASWRTVDLFVGYIGFRNVELGFLVNNLDNVQAPFDSTQTTNIYAAYQSAFHSVVGRFFKLTAKYTF